MTVTTKRCYKCSKEMATELDICPFCKADFIINGTYAIIAEIGSGSQSIVLKARHVTTGQIVALKVFRKDWVMFEGVHLVEREFMILQKLDSPYIIKAYEHGQVDSNFEYIAVEFFPGEPLGDRIKRSGVFDMLTGMSLARQSCEALAEFHRHGITHRDLKLNNVLVNEANQIKFIDLGVCSQQDNLLGTNLYFIGTPEYAAPEQFLCDGVDNRTDIYSFGIVLFFLFTGHYPFEVNESNFGQSTRIKMFKDLHLLQPAPPPARFNPNIKSRLQRVILRCIQKKPETRYQSIEEVLEALKLAHEEYYLRPEELRNTDDKFLHYDVTEAAYLGNEETVSSDALPAGDRPKTHPTAPPAEPAPPREKTLSSSASLRVLGTATKKVGSILKAGLISMAIAVLIIFFLIRSGYISQFGNLQMLESTQVISPTVMLLSDEKGNQICQDTEGNLLGLVKIDPSGDLLIQGQEGIMVGFALPAKLIRPEASVKTESPPRTYALRHGLKFAEFYALFLKDPNLGLTYCPDQNKKRCISLENRLPVKRSKIASHRLNEVLLRPQPLEFHAPTMKTLSTIPVPFDRQSFSRAILLDAKGQTIQEFPLGWGADPLKNQETLGAILRGAQNQILQQFDSSAEIVPFVNLKIVARFGQGSEMLEFELEMLKLKPLAWLKNDWKLTPNRLQFHWTGPTNAQARVELSGPGFSLKPDKDFCTTQNIENFIFHSETITISRPTDKSQLKELHISLYDGPGETAHLLQRRLVHRNEKAARPDTSSPAEPSTAPVEPSVAQPRPKPTECPADMITIKSPAGNASFCMDMSEFSVKKCRALPGTCQFFRNNQKNDADELPLAWVNFSEAQKYCAALGLRLATTTQWQIAATGLPTTLENINVLSPQHKGKKPLPLSEVRADRSQTGIFGLGGNLSEWATDSGGQPYICGKGFDNWVNDPALLATCQKFEGEPGLSRGKSLGFRCVKILPQ